jgi:hypothetical protein
MSAQEVAPEPPPLPAPAAPVRDTRAGGLRAAAGMFAGFALLAAVDAVAIALAVPRPSGGAALRAGHHAFDAAETLGAGLVAGAITGGITAPGRLPRWALALAYTAATAPIMVLALGDDLYRQAAVAFEGRLETALWVLFVALVSLAIPAAHLLGALASRYPRVRLVPAAIALGAMIGDQLYLADDYFGVHGAVAWAAATLAGASLAPLAEGAARALWRRPAGRAGLGAALAFAALGVLVPPPNAVRFELFRQPCAIASWALATTLWRAPRPRAPTPAPSSPWYADRAAEPPVPPTPRPAGPGAPVVVLITIDAVRAEAVNDANNDVIFPNLADMKRRGAWFTRASSPGSQTAVSLTATFSSRYYSELYWSMHGTGSTRFAYAADDPAPRFPGVLTAGGVPTAIYCSVNFLAAEFGVARGFAEEAVIPEGRRHAYARQVIDPVLERLRRAGPGPLFVYTHLMEPHAPYDRGRKDGTEYERYLSEIALADAQIGRVSKLLDQRFPGRGVLIVSADHGEAFGEHQTFQHTKSLYEELLRVPLLIRGAGVRPQLVATPVGLVDLGPTILDLLGVPTPASYQGQSLVPILRGSPAALTRPLLAEGRLRRALYTTDGLKVIADARRKVVEVYDLRQDPGETHNLFDAEPSRSDPALAALDAFFAVNALRRPGYRPPYKP